MMFNFAETNNNKTIRKIHETREFLEKYIKRERGQTLSSRFKIIFSKTLLWKKIVKLAQASINALPCFFKSNGCSNENNCIIVALDELTCTEYSNVNHTFKLPFGSYPGDIALFFLKQQRTQKVGTITILSKLQHQTRMRRQRCS